MRRSRVLVGVTAVVTVAALGVGWAEARQSGPGRPAYTRTTCLLGSPEVRAATAETLAGLDRGIFSSFRVLEPPPPPLSSDHYRGPLWVWATIAGARDRRTHDMRGEWEVALAAGAIAERCSLGLTELWKAVGGYETRYETGPHRLDGGAGVNSLAGRVFAAQASGESDADIIADAKHVLARYDLSPLHVRVLHPLGPALMVEATTVNGRSIEGRVLKIQHALDGGCGRHARFEGLYLALDGPDGPLVRSGVETRAGAGSVWSARGFDTGFAHG